MAGYSPQGAIRLFNTFERLHREYVSKAQSPDQELSQVAIAGIQGYFRTHPLPEERVTQIQRMVAANKWQSGPERALQIRPAAYETTADKQ